MLFRDFHPTLIGMWIFDLFAPPDHSLLETVAGGERLAARIRLAFYSLVWLIPLCGLYILGFDRPELWIVLRGTTIAIAVSAIFVWLAGRDRHIPGISFLTTGFDITLITAVLFFFAYGGSPLVATNSTLVWACYLIFILVSTIRFDIRVSLVAGILAVGEYVVLLLYIAHFGDLRPDELHDSVYGNFSWILQSGRLVLMIVATVSACGIVFRSRKLINLSGMDRLTGLANRLYFDRRLEDELLRARRNNTKLTLVFLDLDHFKKFNDRLGHEAGDAALEMVARTLKGEVRSSDLVARWGGEEFALVLPESELKSALQIMERVREQLSEQQITPDRPVSRWRRFFTPQAPTTITISGGLAEFPREGETEAELLKIADRRLYRAKKEGRNRMIASD